MQQEQPETIDEEFQQSFQSKKKIILVVLAILLLLVASVTLWYLINSGRVNLGFLSAKVPPKLTRETTVAKIASETHPALFYVNLEYDPKKNIATVLNTGALKGDLPRLLPSPPATSPTQFVYKVELISAESQLISAGYDSIHKEIVTTSEGNWSFRVTTRFIPAAELRVYTLDNKLIYSGKMK